MFGAPCQGDEADVRRGLNERLLVWTLCLILDAAVFEVVDKDGVAERKAPEEVAELLAVFRLGVS